MNKVGSLFEKLGPVSIFLCPKFITFSFRNLENCRKKMDVDVLLLALMMKKIERYYTSIFFKNIFGFRPFF